MCEELTLHPRAIYAYELSDIQLRSLYRLNKNDLMCAWRTPTGIVVYLDGPKPNCYAWKMYGWEPFNEEENG
jgi:hypothetical protein